MAPQDVVGPHSHRCVDALHVLPVEHDDEEVHCVGPQRPSDWQR